MTRPVRCLETGRRYPSFAQAARHLGLKPQGIQLAVFRRRPYAGLTWELIYPEDHAAYRDYRRRGPQERRVPGPRPRAVECEDGRVFPSIAAAARMVGVHYATLYRCIHSYQTCAGLYWRLVR